MDLLVCHSFYWWALSNKWIYSNTVAICKYEMKNKCILYRYRNTQYPSKCRKVLIIIFGWWDVISSRIDFSTHAWVANWNNIYNVCVCVLCRDIVVHYHLRNTGFFFRCCWLFGWWAGVVKVFFEQCGCLANISGSNWTIISNSICVYNWIHSGLFVHIIIPQRFFVTVCT